MNVAIVGSRDWDDEFVIERAVNDVAENVTDDIVIISGGARGADRIAGQIAWRWGFPLLEHFPDWEGQGKRAGYLRNELIVRDADLVLAFQKANSRGTQHTIDIARRQGVPVIVWTVGAPDGGNDG